MKLVWGIKMAKQEVKKQEVKDLTDISKLSLSLMEGILNKKPESITSVGKANSNWKVVVEALERKAVPDTQDILGRYEFDLDKHGNFLGYRQLMLRRRGELVKEGE